MHTVLMLTALLSVLLLICMSAWARWIHDQTYDYWQNKRKLTELLVKENVHPSEWHEHNDEIERLSAEIVRQERLLPWWKQAWRVGVSAAIAGFATTLIGFVLLMVGLFR